MQSKQGVTQGDPLGPLLFCPAWQRIVEKLPEALKLNVWYLDDGHLAGTPEDVAAALKIISGLDRTNVNIQTATSSTDPNPPAPPQVTLNVRPNVNKCKVWGPAAPQLMAALQGTLWSSMSIVPWSPGTGLKVLSITQAGMTSLKRCSQKLWLN
jgi:hypothetical protein